MSRCRHFLPIAADEIIKWCLYGREVAVVRPQQTVDHLFLGVKDHDETVESGEFSYQTLSCFPEFVAAMLN